jgi:hypothetical protein
MFLHPIQHTTMPGGIGFSKQGQNSNKYNRSLQNGGSKKRFSLVDSKINNRVGAVTNYVEIQAWKNNKSERDGTLTKWIYDILIFIAVLVCLALLFFKI